eukprot:TRINITY_DN1308_c0_g3_i1.p1 TRINITY_DN1308_c0_g3~~TRINITY_DN1308_c0_g3_i1.p1  ORF type:complete len:131 (+),score=19.71 TRINITY_DN1308_c0_g3_i1:99-491(+)
MMSWLLTTFTVALGAEKLEHEWIELETDCAYYVTQLYSDGVISFDRFTNRYDANQEGLDCAGRASDTSVWTERDFKFPSAAPTIATVKRWLSEYRGARYDVNWHNCKHFASDVWRALTPSFCLLFSHLEI